MLKRLTDLLDWIYKKKCYFCKSSKEAVKMCSKCYEEMDFLPVKPSRTVKGKKVYCAGIYSKNLQKLIRGLKYHNQRDLAFYLAQFMSEYFEKISDKKDYEVGMPVFERKCVRAIIEKNGKIAVQRGRAGDCKILGGGMDGEEDFETALSREVLEEGGLILCPGSMQLLGEIEEKRRDLFETDKIYHCHTYFFACTVEERTTEPHMTESEKAKGYHLEWMTPEEIVKANEPFSKEPWIYRDTAFVKMMMEGNL